MSDTSKQRFSWRQHPDLMARLSAAQNSIAAPIDIMTFAGFCESEAELRRHVEYYEQRAVEPMERCS